MKALNGRVALGIAPAKPSFGYSITPVGGSRGCAEPGGRRLPHIEDRLPSGQTPNNISVEGQEAAVQRLEKF